MRLRLYPYDQLYPVPASLKAEHGVRSIPVVKGDTVKVLRGTYKGREGVIASSYRRKWVITIEGVHRDKASGATVPIGVDASKCEVIGLKLNKDRKAILARKSNKKAEKSEDAEMKAVSKLHLEQKVGRRTDEILDFAFPF
ncbi:uL24 family ribosomal protein [Sporobolomyces salmoneus]|uniref:uL24 family ribosomal protein n=1 Tax=Sporobolomyces salmoneus TaxID=183962 RepID=UPI0031750B3E